MDTKKVRTYFQCLALTALIVLTHSSPLTARTSNAQNRETNVANIDTQEISQETIVRDSVSKVIQEVVNRENTQEMINREEMIIWEDTAAKDIFHKDTGSGDTIVDISDNKDIGSGDIDINESKDDSVVLGMDFLKDFIIRDLDNTELQNKNLKEEQLDAFSRDLSDSSSSSSSETAQDGSISDSSSSSSDTAQDGSIESSRSSRERRSRRTDDKRRTEEKKNSHRIRIRPIALRQPRTDGSDSSVAHDFLRKYGYFNQGKPLELQLAPTSESGSKPGSMPEADAVRMFQSYYGLPQTGELDEQTLALMTKQRCGVADIPQEVREAPADDNPSQFNLLGEKWDHTRLTWRLDRQTKQLPYEDQRRALRDSLEMWRSVAPLEFTELRDQPQNGHVDINVQFGKRDHNDGYPFDGKGTVLAHAFGPGDGSLSGDLHVDDDEKWALGDNIGDHNDLFLVIVHELGHSLGLAHSRDTNAIMFPYYGFADKLGQDDIKAIQYLYGARIDTPITTQRPTRTDAPMTTRQPITDRPTRLPTRQPITDHTYTKSAVFTNRPSTTTATPAECRLEFDHVIQDDAERPDVYTGFRGNQVLRFSSDGLQGGFPSSIDAVFPGAPSNAESIFTIPEKSATYFVKGNRVWKYVGDELGSGYPKDLNPQHFQETIRFVLPLVDTYGKRRIFVFGTTYFQEYNFDQLPPQQPRAHTIVQYWPYVTTDVKYAVMGTDNYIYLIRPNSHVMLDSYRREVPGGKKDGPPDWMRPACLLSSAYGSGSASSTLCGSWQIVVLSIISLVLMKVLRN